MRVGFSGWISVPLRRDTWELTPSRGALPEQRPCEHIQRKQLSASRQNAFTRNQPGPWTRTSQTPGLWEINVSYGSHPISGFCYGARADWDIHIHTVFLNKSLPFSGPQFPCMSKETIGLKRSLQLLSALRCDVTMTQWRERLKTKAAPQTLSGH